MAHAGGVEAYGAEGELHDGAGAEGADQRAHAHRAAQQPAGERRQAQKPDAHRADGHPPHPLGQAHQQGVPRPAAQGGDHVGVLGIGHDEQAHDHHRDARHRGATRRNRVDPIEEIHGLPHHHGVDEHRDADGLPEQYVDEQYGAGHRNGRRAVEYPQRPGQPQVEHVPGARPDVRLDRQIDPKAVDEQAGRRQDHVQGNGPRRAVLTQPADGTWIDIQWKHLICLVFRENGQGLEWRGTPPPDAGIQITTPARWSISCWMIWAVKPVKVLTRGFMSRVCHWTLMVL